MASGMVVIISKVDNSVVCSIVDVGASCVAESGCVIAKLVCVVPFFLSVSLGPLSLSGNVMGRGDLEGGIGVVFSGGTISPKSVIFLIS